MTTVQRKAGKKERIRTLLNDMVPCEQMVITAPWLAEVLDYPAVNRACSGKETAPLTAVEANSATG
jgi:hypothetical protein